jgi:DNA repair protein RecO (recombination protein O)
MVVLFTKDFGKIRSIAKGERRSRRRFVGCLEPGNCVRISFYKSGPLPMLDEAVFSAAPSAQKFPAASYMVELVDALTAEWAPNRALYHVLTETLRSLGRCEDGLLLRFFEVKLLHSLGLMPSFGACVGCKRNTAVAFFDCTRGGVLCRACAGGGRMDLMPIAAATAGILSMAARMPFSKLPRIKADAESLREGAAALGEFIRQEIGRELKTRRFLEGFGI